MRVGRRVCVLDDVYEAHAALCVLAVRILWGEFAFYLVDDASFFGVGGESADDVEEHGAGCAEDVFACCDGG